MPKSLADKLSDELAAVAKADTPDVSHKDQTETTLTLDILSPRIKTLEDALRQAEVDRTLWDVDRFTVNSWEMGCKVEAVVGGRKITQGAAITPLWQVKVWLKTKTGLSPREFRAQLLADMRRAAPSYPKVKLPKRRDKGELLFEIALFDHHLGKLAWEPETGSNYDQKIAEKLFLEAVESFIDRAKPYPIAKILLPLGNDFLHTDNSRNTTTAGTPQDCEGRWQRLYRHSRIMACVAIERLREVAPVNVVIVPGNHDTEKIFCLGDAIECQFHLADNVAVDNGPTKRKYIQWGTNLLGFTHGNEEKHADLPNLMAHDVPELWAATSRREFHLGHFHKERETNYTPRDAHGSTIVRILPSLSGTDAWHKSKGYRAPRASEAYLFHRTLGYFGHFSTGAAASV